MIVSGIRFILMDIEGTTTDIDFVHQILFPYSAERMENFITANLQNPEVRNALDAVKQTILNEDGLLLNDEQAIDTLLRWIADDRKQTALKDLQGLIWKQGFNQGDYQGHVYEDVPPALAQWKEQGIGLGIYSSGSVQAQKLVFGHSVFGDLTPYFAQYFDTTMGGKKEAQSYQKIAETLDLQPEQVLFLSDVEEELDAAHQAGLQTAQLVRPGTDPSENHPVVHDFSEITLSKARV